VALLGRVVVAACPSRHAPPSGERNGATVKKLLTWLAIAFVIFYIMKSPESSADIVRSAGQALGNAASSLATFVGSLA
jgi:hypothetical protein